MVLPAKGVELTQSYEISSFVLEDQANGAQATLNLTGLINLSKVYGSPLLACSTQWELVNEEEVPNRIQIDNKPVADFPEALASPSRSRLDNLKLEFSIDQPDIFEAPISIVCNPGRPEVISKSSRLSNAPMWGRLFRLTRSASSAPKYASEEEAKIILDRLSAEGFPELSSSLGTAKLIEGNIDLSALKAWYDNPAAYDNTAQGRSALTQDSTVTDRPVIVDEPLLPSLPNSPEVDSVLAEARQLASNTQEAEPRFIRSTSPPKSACPGVSTILIR